MAETFALEVATPERLVIREAATEAQIPAKNGYIGVLPGHAPLLSELGTGYASYTVEGHKYFFAVHGGFVEVLPEKVRVLADTVEKAEEIDVQRAEAALRKAQEQLSDPHVEVDPALALSAMFRAQARLEAAAQARDNHSRTTAPTP
jgi:F-type H+-transporting ATPase subunit epsilon